MTTRFIYKICPTDLWQTAQQSGQFTGAGIDIQDGFIHFSTASQTAETLALHFTGKDGLTLAEIDANLLDIKWEPSRGGQLFPHLYAALPFTAVTNQWALMLDHNGVHQLPALRDK